MHNILTGSAAVWGIIAVGLFADNPEPLDTTSGRSGLFKGKIPSWLTGQISFLELCSMWHFGYFQMFPIDKPELLLASHVSNTTVYLYLQHYSLLSPREMCEYMHGYKQLDRIGIVLFLYRHYATNRKVAGSIPDGVISKYNLTLQGTLGPGVYSASNRNEYQKH
jgi:hypothetical protein